MNETLISIETARLLKSKGFDIKVDHVYLEDFYKDVKSAKNDYGSYVNGVYPQPSQPVLQKYLREVHGIHITVYWNGDKNYDYSIKTDPTKILNHVKHCESYEVALELALVESLNLIQ
jgi:NADPH:quinone reductase-like Zn-dependent oxidoreductase